MTTYLAASLMEYDAHLRDFIRRGLASPATEAEEQSSFEEFNQLALNLFALQFAHNAPCRQFCEARGVHPQTIKEWSDVPVISTAGFKELELTSLARAQRTQVFYSSGTTEQRHSRHFHSRESLALYEASALPWFRKHFPTSVSAELVMLTPPPGDAIHSSLVHMFGAIRRELGAPGSVFTGHLQRDGTWTLDLEKTIVTLHEAIAVNCPVTLLGTAFSFVHLLDHLMANDSRLRLPAGSRVMETGGYKGRSRTLLKAELHALITQRLGIPEDQIVCEYGMSELSSQAYDGVAGDPTPAGRIFHFPPWARAQIISPETGEEAAEGETGLVRIYDLANVYSVMAVQTEDLGVRRGGGFELIGRAALAEARGCSLRSH